MKTIDQRFEAALSRFGVAFMRHGQQAGGSAWYIIENQLEVHVYSPCGTRPKITIKRGFSEQEVWCEKSLAFPETAYTDLIWRALEIIIPMVKLLLFIFE